MGARSTTADPARHQRRIAAAVRRAAHTGSARVRAPRWRALETLVRWLKLRALEALEPRAAHFAARLGLAAPPVKLSNARTQWGICVESGAIRLSWRLVHVVP